MAFATVFFAGKAWLMPVAAMGIGALLFVVFSYVRSAASMPLKLLCAVLKLLGIAALLACLLEPMWSREKAKPGANVFAIVADNSRSLTLTEPDAKRSRGAEMREALAGERTIPASGCP